MAVEFHVAEFVDLCGYPHRWTYAEAVTMPSVLALHEAVAPATAVLFCIVAVPERAEKEFRCGLRSALSRDDAWGVSATCPARRSLLISDLLSSLS
ncbi:hypothetical protein [Streptomyces sp. NBC_01198]|uniref:hypothetical protein n=1 Tax=Streptomyces sp. NBC_01198 TaxID=2903769 RepID=UPI002E0F8BA9|nr:hypothetical protein OG702_00265 [Streptomyces sp. NBC_01198]